MAAAAVSLACPLRRSTRLAHAHPHRKYHIHIEHDPEHDSSSSDPENELTPRALRALKRQRLTLDPDGLPFPSRQRSKRRRKDIVPSSPSPHPSHPKRSSPRPKRHQHTDRQAFPLPFSFPLPLDSCHSLHSTATPHAASDPINDVENRPPSPVPFHCKPELSIPLPLDSPPESEPLTPLTPLTPSPESSPSLPGHDRQPLPPHDPLPPPAPIEPLPIPEPTSDAYPPPSPLDPAFDTLIPFDAIHPQFDQELSVQLPPPPTPPQLQALDLQGQFHSFPQHQLYVPPNPVFVRDREINIWKLACQERVDCLLRRYGSDYIKALVESQARSVSTSTPPSQTMFRLYTPASYTYTLSSWASPSGTRKPSPVDDHPDDPAWPMDDSDWVDADVDMEDDDEEDDDDDDDAPDGDAERQGEVTLETADGLPAQPTTAMDVDGPTPDARKAMPNSDPPPPPDPPIRLSTPVTYPLPPPPPLTPPILPPLSSLHVPLLSEPPRAFMGRGTPPDRRRLIEWSSSGRLAHGMGPPLYLSPVPQRHPSPDVGIVAMSVDSPIHPPPLQTQHTHGEWTSFLYSMLEGDGVGVGVGVPNAGHASEPTWYELGLASVPPVIVPELPPTQTATPSVEQPVDDASNNSSSTLRFALG